MAIKNNIRFILFLPAILCAQIQPEKCGTFRHISALNQAKKLHVELRNESRPALQKNLQTKNQKIRIHYDTSGINVPAMVDSSGNRVPNSYQRYIDTLRVILDSVWNTEINAYGFIAPPNDDNRGGGNEYDFYIMELSPGVFGETNIETDLPVGPTKSNQQYATYIRIDNDFGVGYRTKGIPAILATAAHEFHHAIQVGGSGVWEDDQFYFYELCAEAMENTVFNDAKDYLYDVRTYFNNISSIPLFILRSQSSFAGYERAIWGMYLMKTYGTSIMKDIWDEMKLFRPIPSLKNIMALRITTIEKEYSQYALWMFYTNYRSSGNKYFIDARMFPPLSFSSLITLQTAENIELKTSRSMVTNYIRVAKQQDTAFFVISNTNLSDAESNTNQVFPFQLNVAPYAVQNYQKINNSMYAQFTVTDPNNWSFALSTDTNAVPKPKNFDVVEVFPNPYKVNGENLLFISLQEELSDNNNVELFVYSSAGGLVYSGQPQFSNIFGKRFAVWNGRNVRGSLAASGIYFYVLSKRSAIVRGKFAIIR